MKRTRQLKRHVRHARETDRILQYCFFFVFRRRALCVSAAGESRSETRASARDASFAEVYRVHVGTYPLVEPDGVRPRTAEIALDGPATEGSCRDSFEDNRARQGPHPN